MRLPFLIITILITLIGDSYCIYHIYSTGGHANWIYFPLFLAITYMAVYFFSFIICVLFDYDPHLTEKRIREEAEYQKRKAEKQKREHERFQKELRDRLKYPELYKKLDKLREEKEDEKKDDDHYHDDDDSFTRSAAIGYLTDNPLLGGALGGSYSGGLFGSGLN